MGVPLVIYMLPVFFMIHELEEIVMMKKWIVRNSSVLYRRFPKLSFAAGFIAKVTTRSIAIIAIEEFFIVLACTLFSMYSGNIAAWYCCLAAFGIHLVIHLLQFLVWRNYIPAIITTLLCLPYCVFAIYGISDLLSCKEFALYTAAGVIAGSINLLVMHTVAGKIPECGKSDCKCKH